MIQSTRTILLTGGDNGIGLGLATALVENGDRVAVFDLSGENLAALDRANPARVFFIPCDITDAARVQAGVNAVLAKWGRIDILINDACLAIFKPFREREMDEIRREFEVNYFGMLNLIRAVLPCMRKNGGGIVHNFSSGVGLTGFPGICGYASTKGAIEALTRTLALELEPDGITVNLMHPPLTRTRSASPLGLPTEMMVDPMLVGRRLAKKVGSQKAVITPDQTSALGLWGMQHFPVSMGRFMAKMTRRYQAGQEKAAQA